MILAQRRKKIKKNRRGKKNRWSKLYEDICTEKFSQKNSIDSLSQKFSDPCTPVVIYRTSKIQSVLHQVSKKRTWFFTPELLALALGQKWTMQENAVNTQDTSDSRFRFWMLFS